MSSHEPVPRESRMRLGDAEALDLYLAVIGRNVSAMEEQAALLRTALAARRALLNELGLLPRSRIEPSHQTDSSQTG